MQASTASGSYSVPLPSSISFRAASASILRALAAYADKPVWHKIQENGMRRDFSWNRSAEEYLALYEMILKDV